MAASCKKNTCGKCAPVFTWNSAETPAELDSALKTLSARYPALNQGKGTVKISFSRSGNEQECSVKKENGNCVITYRKTNMALRMVGNLLSGVVPAQADYCPYEMFGVMIDCSRNAVMKPDYLKSYLDRLAILGYNMVMLYTEDTYQIKDEPYFGVMRGAYTPEEIREIDDYAASLNIELIPCIQTLAHLEQIFRWGKYNEINDLNGILLVDEPKTYELIEKMLVTWKNSVRSRRIHLGMDEAHGLGSGRFKQLHGKESSFSIINRHLGKVVELCRKHGLQPMMWSDMYFRCGSKNSDYYDPEWTLPPADIVNNIPKEIELVYWDYYHDDKQFYLNWIKHHRALSQNEPVMGSGVWTWDKFWYDHFYTESTVTPCMEACREAKVKDVFFTMWGDDGGFCDYDSAFAGLAFASELSFTGSAKENLMEKKFHALFNGASYKENLVLANICRYQLPKFLWDDPIMMLAFGGFMNEKTKRSEYDITFDFRQVADEIAKAQKKLEKAKFTTDGGNMLFAKTFADALHAKFVYAEKYFAAYKSENRRAAMKKIIPLAEDYLIKLDLFAQMMREMWFSHNKPFGFETIQIRLAGQLARTEEAIKRIQEVADGEADVIPETEDLFKIQDDVYTTFISWARASHGTTIV